MKDTILLFIILVPFSQSVFASKDANQYDVPPYRATITRDIWGVPHIFGKRDSDAAFGLAYAHAQDDIKNIAENMHLYRAKMGLKIGFKGAVTDYLIKALEIEELIRANYYSKLSSEVREVVEGYAAGLNYWNSVNKNNKYKALFPITERDVIAGFVIQNLFFSGVVTEIEFLQKGESKYIESKNQEQSYFYEAYQNILGSNAIAVGPNKTDDGSTRLVINSHQPLEGPVAWYEAHVRSGEGWNMMGGTFPGAPFIFVGFNENLGWGLTVNKPDLTDVYKLKINPHNKNQYLLDQEWVDFEINTIKLPIKLFGPIKWTFKKKVKKSLHGPVIENDDGVYAIRFAGMRDISQVEQWYRLNKSQNKDDWMSAMNIRAIVSFNAVYADKEKNILFLHNSASPKRMESIDWSYPVDGTKSSLIWNDVVPLNSLPLITNPLSGWLVSTNQDPFRVTEHSSNLLRNDYSDTLGLQTRMTNRAYRALEMFENMDKVTLERLLAVKFDNKYSKRSRSYKYIQSIFDIKFNKERLIKAQKLLKNWNLSTDFNNRGAALGVCVLSPEWLAEQEFRKPPSAVIIFKECVKNIIRKYKRIDPKWSEVNYLVRGTKRVPVQGGPDTLRAIYGETQKDGSLKAVAGDGLVVFVEWGVDGNLLTKSVHQYGSATQDKMSEHYDDQIELFVNESLKDTYFKVEDLELHAKSIINIPFNYE